jgi:bifunctional pyridoxal-dependent enzyme with beta-cystathionase and maltose regulon repressor activities
MATSGSTDFELDVAEYVEEAFERCGIEARTGYDLKSAKRSLNLLLADWANRGLNQWTIKQRTIAMVSGTGAYAVGTDVIDVL